jgi:hypothetical protein
MPSNEYRRNAAECLRVCAEVKDAESKRILASVAEAWMRLATRAETNRKSETTNMTVPHHHAGSRPDADGLRELLRRLSETEVAGLDERVGQRVGAVIARAALDRQKQ